MAAFTSLALVAGGLLAGAGAAKLASRKKDQPQNQSLAPGPTTPDALAPPAPPILNPADVNAAGLAAGQRQRKRAAGGSLLTNPIAPLSNTMPVPGRTSQRTLLGA